MCILLKGVATLYVGVLAARLFLSNIAYSNQKDTLTMKGYLLIAALAVCVEPAFSQTNQPTQIKFYSATNYTNTIHLQTPGPTRWIAGDIYAVYYQTKRVAVTITDLKDAEYGKVIIIQNYPHFTALAIGQSVNFYAEKIGTIQGVNMAGDNVAGLVLELWDYVDLDASARRLAIEEEKAAQIQREKAREQDAKNIKSAQIRAVLWLQSQATNGDAGAQCSLGEHYLNGQGCQTNREQGIYWLQKAASQGSIEASNKLVSLKK